MTEAMRGVLRLCEDAEAMMSPGRRGSGMGGVADEDMAPSDTNNDYKVRSFLHLHSGFGYNSLGSTCTCHYLIVGSNVFHNGSSSKLNFRFVGSPTVPHWEGHNSSIRSAIEVNEHLMESLFDKLSNRSGSISISHRQGLQITNIFCRCFCWELHCRYGLVIHPWDPGPSGSTLPRTWRTHQESPWTSSSLATTLGGQQGCPSQARGPV